MLQPSSHAVANDSFTNRLADDEANSGFGLRGVIEQMDDNGLAAGAATRSDHSLIVSGTAKSSGSGQHADAQPRQAASWLRPLRRRPARMARPARVRMRSRKPWVLLRRRLFGWNVRLLTGQTPKFGLAGNQGQQGDRFDNTAYPPPGIAQNRVT